MAGTVIGDKGTPYAGEEVMIAALGVEVESDVDGRLTLQANGKVIARLPPASGRLCHVARRKRQQHHAFVDGHAHEHGLLYNIAQRNGRSVRTAAILDKVGHVVADCGTHALASPGLWGERERETERLVGGH
jgi:hypothetical protein